MRNPPRASGCEVEIAIVNNSPWSPAIKGVGVISNGSPFVIYDVPMFVMDNPKSNKFHASALDCIVEMYDFDYLMALETDVLALRPDWLQWFLDQMRDTDYAVGMWHHEQFINPSCTLYRARALYEMRDWCENYAPQDELRWGENFSLSAPLDENLKLSENPRAILENMKGWIAGPFAEKRGFPEGTVLKESPSGQLKGPGWYEPGQQLHHWCVNESYSYTICPTSTAHRYDGLPLQTIYGANTPDSQRAFEADDLMHSGGYTAHMWGGTRALDILKHPVTCGFVQANTPAWLVREARFWKQVVPQEVQEKTLKLIREHGFHITGQGTDHVSDRDREAASFVRECYKEGGVEI
jgi:hypothetical protein